MRTTGGNWQRGLKQPVAATTGVTAAQVIPPSTPLTEATATAAREVIRLTGPAPEETTDVPAATALEATVALPAPVVVAAAGAVNLTTSFVTNDNSTSPVAAVSVPLGVKAVINTNTGHTATEGDDVWVCVLPNGVPPGPSINPGACVRMKELLYVVTGPNKEPDGDEERGVARGLPGGGRGGR